MKLHPHIQKQIDKYREIDAINTTRPVQMESVELEAVDISEVIVLSTLPPESFEEDLTTSNLADLNREDTRRFIDVCGYRSGVKK